MTSDAPSVTPIVPASMIVVGGATATLEDSDVVDNDNGGIAVDEGGTFLADRTFFRANRSDAEDKNGFGVDVSGGTATLRSCALLSNAAMGAAVRSGSLVVEQSLVRDNESVGLYSYGGDTKIVILGSTIEHQHARGDGELGMGVLAGGPARVPDTLVRNNVYAGVAFEASRTPGGADVDVDGCIIEGTTADRAGFGHGLIAGNDARIRIERTVLYDNESVGAVFSNTRGLVRSSTIAANNIGTLAQSGSMLQEIADAPDAVPPLKVLFTTDTTVVGNVTRVGSGEVPIPVF